MILLFSSNCSSCEEVDMLLVGRGTGEGGDKMRRSLSSDQEGEISEMEKSGSNLRFAEIKLNIAKKYLNECSFLIYNSSNCCFAFLRS